MYQLIFYVPVSHLEVVKTALFDAGAGRIGNYDQCAWQIQGRGQFRPLIGASPAIGQAQVLGQDATLEEVDEFRVEMVLAQDVLAASIKALRQAHPYEEPAFGVFAMLDLNNLGLDG